MLQEKLGIDERDVLILSAFMHNSEVSQAELAKRIGLSQPSINARINKLKQKGLLATQCGIDLSTADVLLARVDFTASNAETLLNNLAKCSFFVNGFVLSGKHNVSMLVIGHNLKKIEAIIDKHLRSNLEVKDINMSVVVSSTKNFVCSIDLEKERHEECQNIGSCENCAHLKNTNENINQSTHPVSIRTE